MMWLLVVLLAFDPAATIAQLGAPASRAGALKAVLSLDALELAAARKSGVPQAVAEVVADAESAFDQRVLAVRAAALLGDAVAVPGLAALAVAEGDPQQVALAREATRALRQLRALDALAGALGSSDPQVRATAAAAGPAPETLCVMLQKDAWPAVRSAAARGLEKHPAQAKCLAAAFEDADPMVALVAIQIAGRTGAAEPVRAPLRALAGSPKAAVALRGAAFVSLAKLGDTEPATKALATHLANGGIEPLAVAAVQAMAAVGDADAVRGALQSESERVRKAAERALTALAPPASAPTAPDPADDDPE